MKRVSGRLILDHNLRLLVSTLHRKAMNDSSHTCTAKKQIGLHLGKGRRQGSHRSTQTITQKASTDSVGERLLLVIACDDFHELTFSSSSEILIINLFTQGTIWLVQQSLIYLFQRQAL